jgi:hypothetical protein
MTQSSCGERSLDQLASLASAIFSGEDFFKNTSSIRDMTSFTCWPKADNGGYREFLDTINPVDKRTCLAMHASHVKEVKRDFIRRNKKLLAAKNSDSSSETLLKMDPLSCSSSGSIVSSSVSSCSQTTIPNTAEYLEQAAVTAAALVRWKRHYLQTPGGQPLKSNQEEADPMSATNQEHTQEEAPSNSTILVALNEPKSLRFSLYEKFVRRYEFAYNQQDIQDMVQTVMLPVCSPFLVRQNKLWSKRVTMAPNGGSSPNSPPVSTPAMACQYIVVQDTTFVGVASLSSVFNLIFTRLPDCVINYQQSRIRFIPNEGTFVYTPLTFFCTAMIPEQDFQELSAISSEKTCTLQKQQENRKRKFSETSQTMKLIHLEATGWNIVQFDLNNVVVFKQDNFYFSEMKGMEPYSVSDTVLWDYVLKP